MTYRPNWDALALRALIDNDQEELDRLDKLSRYSIGRLCPECGEKEEIDADNDNFLCLACGHQWDGSQWDGEA
jgi:hypothetical protein